MNVAGNRDLDNYQREYAASPFEEHLAAARREFVLEFLARHKLRDLLEVGCAGKPHSLMMLSEALQSAVRDKVTNAEFAFISRAEMGLYSLLHQLKARVNVRETWRRCSRLVTSGH